MQKEVEIRELNIRDSLKSSFISLINRYRGHATNDAIFDWQFSHQKNSSVITALVENDIVLGTQCMMPFSMITESSIYLSGKCENSYLDESLRGTGKFTDLFEFATDLCKEKKVKLLWAFTPALKPYSRLGFEIYENCMRQTFLWLRRSSISEYFSGRKGKDIHYGIASYWILLKSIYAQKSKMKDSNVEHLEITNQMRQVNDLERLQKRIASLYPSVHQFNLSQEFIDWRINSNPNVSLHNLFAYEDETLIGHVVYKNENDGKIDIKLLIYEDGKSISIFKSVLNHIRKLGAELVIYRGNIENALNMKFFQFISQLNNRGIPEDGWGFVFKTLGDDDFRISKENLLMNHLWTEGYE